MSVLNDDKYDDLLTAVNQMESKVMILIENMQTMNQRIKQLETIAKKHGHKVKDDLVEADQCTIN